MLRRLAVAHLIIVLLLCPYFCLGEMGGCCATHRPVCADQPSRPACCGHCQQTQDPRPAPPHKERCHLPCLCNGAVVGSETPDIGVLLVTWLSGDVTTAPTLVAGRDVELRSGADDGGPSGGRALCIAHSIWLC